MNEEELAEQLLAKGAAASQSEALEKARTILAVDGYKEEVKKVQEEISEMKRQEKQEEREKRKKPDYDVGEEEKSLKELMEDV